MGRGGMFVRATVVLTACALAAALLGAVNASARSQGFYIYNLTHKPMKLDEIQLLNDAKFDKEATSPKPPKVGDVLQPGVDSGPKYDHNHIELERRLVAPFGVARLFYAPGIARDRYGARLDTGQRRPYCEWFSPDPYCTTDAPSIYFLDEPGTVYEFPASEAQKHAEFVQQLCTDGNLDEEVVTCDFDIKEAPDRKAFGSPHLVGAVVPNCATETGNPVIDGEHVIDVDHEQEDETAQENSFGVKITVEAQFGAFIEKLKTAIETSYKGTWSSSETFKDKVAYKVRPGEIGYTIGENPVIRVTGDLTLVIGNTTLILRDIYIDNPDKSRNNVQWRPIRKEMTAEQKKQICDEGGPADVDPRAPASHAEITQNGTRGANTLYGGRESTTLLGRGGNDILLGASGHDTLVGGAGRDVIHGGRGSDTIVDASGRTLVTTAGGGPEGPDSVDVRDGKGDDRVTCGDGAAIVRADRSDRVRHCGT